MQETCVRSLGWEDPGRRAWQPTPVFLPGEPHGQRSLAGCSPWGHKALNTTEKLTVNLYVEAPNPSTSGTVFGNRAFTEVIKLKWGLRLGLRWLASLSEKIKTQTERKGHVRAQGEDSHLPAKKRGFRGDQCCWHLELDFQPPELWENKFLLFKPPAWGPLWRQS